MPVLIAWNDKAASAINRLRFADKVGGVARSLQRYLVNVPQGIRAQLIGRGAAKVLQPEKFGEQFVVLVDMDLYREDVGLDVSDMAHMEAAKMILC